MLRRGSDEFVVGKNYRLQDIQLSKNRVVRSPPLLSAGTPYPTLTRHERAAEQNRFQSQPANRRPLTRGLQRQRLVENTGLEPVTSWLQTRRSPS